MLKRVRKTVAEFLLLEQGDHVLIAVSGGADSVALLRALVLLSPEYKLKLTTAHLNHGLRGIEADEEERFVRSLCAGIGMECLCKTVDILALKRGKGQSTEESGREERYRFLDEAAKQCGATKIATGHHREDQAETLLMNLLRGSGLEGLKGILPVRGGRIIRPLLHVAKMDILKFLNRQGLSYREDSSNLSPLFLRNRIRHDLIPALTAYNPGIVEGLSRTADIIRREDDYLRTTVRELLHREGIAQGGTGSILPLPFFMGLHEALKGRIIKTLLEAATPSGKGIAYRHVEAVLNLARASVRSRISLDLPGLIRVEKKEGSLRIGKVDFRQVRRDKSRQQVLKA
jgi:tRNA(Ile)-lysidine synthase